MFAQLGTIIFKDMLAPDQMNDTRTTTYAEHALIESKPRLQRMGEGLQEMTISMHFHADFCNPGEQYDLLNNSRASGEIMPLIMGDGFVEGDFVIFSLGRKVNSCAQDGSYISIVVDVTLKEFYDPNKILTAQTRAKKNAFATTENRPLPVNPVPSTPPPTAQATKSVQQSNVLQTAVDKKTKEFETKVDTETGGIISQGQKVVDLAHVYKAKTFALVDKFSAELSKVSAILAQYPIIAAYVPQLNAAIGSAQTEITTLRNLVNSYDTFPNPIATVINATNAVNLVKAAALQNSQVKEAMKQVNKYSQPLANLVASRTNLRL